MAPLRRAARFLCLYNVPALDFWTTKCFLLSFLCVSLVGCHLEVSDGKRAYNDGDAVTERAFSANEFGTSGWAGNLPASRRVPDFARSGDSSAVGLSSVPLRGPAVEPCAQKTDAEMAASSVPSPVSSYEEGDDDGIDEEDERRVEGQAVEGREDGGDLKVVQQSGLGKGADLQDATNGDGEGRNNSSLGAALGSATGASVGAGGMVATVAYYSGQGPPGSLGGVGNVERDLETKMRMLGVRGGKTAAGKRVRASLAPTEMKVPSLVDVLDIPDDLFIGPFKSRDPSLPVLIPPGPQKVPPGDSMGESPKSAAVWGGTKEAHFPLEDVVIAGKGRQINSHIFFRDDWSASKANGSGGLLDRRTAKPVGPLKIVRRPSYTLTGEETPDDSDSGARSGGSPQRDVWNLPLKPGEQTWFFPSTLGDAAPSPCGSRRSSVAACSTPGCKGTSRATGSTDGDSSPLPTSSGGPASREGSRKHSMSSTTSPSLPDCDEKRRHLLLDAEIISGTLRDSYPVNSEPLRDGTVFDFSSPANNRRKSLPAGDTGSKAHGGLPRSNSDNCLTSFPERTACGLPMSRKDVESGASFDTPSKIDVNAGANEEIGTQRIEDVHVDYMKGNNPPGKDPDAFWFKPHAPLISSPSGNYPFSVLHSLPPRNNWPDAEGGDGPQTSLMALNGPNTPRDSSPARRRVPIPFGWFSGQRKMGVVPILKKYGSVPNLRDISEESTDLVVERRSGTFGSASDHPPHGLSELSVSGKATTGTDTDVSDVKSPRKIGRGVNQKKRAERRKSGVRVGGRRVLGGRTLVVGFRPGGHNSATLPKWKRRPGQRLPSSLRRRRRKLTERSGVEVTSCCSSCENLPIEPERGAKKNSGHEKDYAFRTLRSPTWELVGEDSSAGWQPEGESTSDFEVVEIAGRKPLIETTTPKAAHASSSPGSLEGRRMEEKPSENVSELDDEVERGSVRGASLAPFLEPDDGEKETVRVEPKSEDEGLFDASASSKRRNTGASPSLWSRLKSYLPSGKTVGKTVAVTAVTAAVVAATIGLIVLVKKLPQARQKRRRRKGLSFRLRTKLNRAPLNWFEDDGMKGELVSAFGPGETIRTPPRAGLSVEQSAN